MSRSCVYRGQRTPDYRSARNNLYSGISLVRQVRSLISLPCSVSLCFWSFLVSSFPRFLVFAFPCFPVSSFPRFRVFSFPRFRVSSFPRFPFRIPSRSPFCFMYRILFHDPRFSTDSCSSPRFRFLFRFPFPAPFPVPIPVPAPVLVPVPRDSASSCFSLRSRAALLYIGGSA